MAAVVLSHRTRRPSTEPKWWWVQRSGKSASVRELVATLTRVQGAARRRGAVERRDPVARAEAAVRARQGLHAARRRRYSATSTASSRLATSWTMSGSRLAQSVVREDYQIELSRRGDGKKTKLWGWD